MEGQPRKQTPQEAIATQINIGLFADFNKQALRDMMEQAGNPDPRVAKTAQKILQEVSDIATGKK